MIDLHVKNAGRKQVSISASQAKIVRAFYDAAERLLSEPNKYCDSRQAVRSALDDLSGLVKQAYQLSSEEFGQALERAARGYFANVAAIQRNAPPNSNRRH